MNKIACSRTFGFYLTLAYIINSTPCLRSPVAPQATFRYNKYCTKCGDTSPGHSLNTTAPNYAFPWHTSSSSSSSRHTMHVVLVVVVVVVVAVVVVVVVVVVVCLQCWWGTECSWRAAKCPVTTWHHFVTQTAALIFHAQEVDSRRISVALGDPDFRTHAAVIGLETPCRRPVPKLSVREYVFYVFFQISKKHDFLRFF